MRARFIAVGAAGILGAAFFYILRRHLRSKRLPPSPSPFLPLSSDDITKGLRVAHPTLVSLARTLRPGFTRHASERQAFESLM